MMIGAIIGDIAGSRFEFNNYRKKDFNIFDQKSFFTDDSVMSVALAKAILECEDEEKLFEEIEKNFQDFGKLYPDEGYGYRFNLWLNSDDPKPYGSFGNGSAMRVSPVGWAYDSLEKTIEVAKISADVTHNSPEGERGAEVVAACIFLARNGSDKKEIMDFVKENYYDVDFLNSFTIDNLRDDYSFGVTCDTSVPHAIEAFLEGEDFEDVIRTAVSLGGDSDTIGAIAGSIAEAYYGVPDTYRTQANTYLDSTLKKYLDAFEEKYQ